MGNDRDNETSQDKGTENKIGSDKKILASKVSNCFSHLSHSDKTQKIIKSKLKTIKRKNITHLVAVIIAGCGSYYAQEQVIQKHYTQAVKFLNTMDGIQVSKRSHLNFGLLSDTAETTLIITPSKINGVRDLGGFSSDNYTIQIKSEISKLGIFSLDADHQLTLIGDAGKVFEIDGDNLKTGGGSTFKIPVDVESSHGIFGGNSFDITKAKMSISGKDDALLKGLQGKVHYQMSPDEINVKVELSSFMVNTGENTGENEDDVFNFKSFSFETTSVIGDCDTGRCFAGNSSIAIKSENIDSHKKNFFANKIFNWSSEITDGHVKYLDFSFESKAKSIDSKPLTSSYTEFKVNLDNIVRVSPRSIPEVLDSGLNLGELSLSGNSAYGNVAVDVTTDIDKGYSKSILREPLSVLQLFSINIKGTIPRSLAKAAGIKTRTIADSVREGLVTEDGDNLKVDLQIRDGRVVND